MSVVYRCDVCGCAPDPETYAQLVRQLLDLRHGEYVDVEPGRWLIWHGRGMEAAPFLRHARSLVGAP